MIKAHEDRPMRLTQTCLAVHGQWARLLLAPQSAEADAGRDSPSRENNQMGMEFNENACEVIIDVNKKRIESIDTKLDQLDKERASTQEPAAIARIDREMSQLEFDKSAADMKIKEMKAHLGQ